MGYDLIPKKKGVDCKSGMIFTWPVILNETGACYLFGYGDHTFSPGKYIYVGSRKDGSPVSNDGFEVTKEEACIMARLFRGVCLCKKGVEGRMGPTVGTGTNQDQIHVRGKSGTTG